MLSKNHLDNLSEIMESLQWLIQPDTVLTELPYDLEFICKTDIDRFAEWSRKCVSPQELSEGKFPINRPLIKFFIQQTYPVLPADKAQEKVEFLYKELHRILGMSAYETITLSSANIEKIIDKINEVPGETSFDKTKKRIKVAVSLKWLQDKHLLGSLSKQTANFVTRLGDFYGRVKKGEAIRARDIGIWAMLPDDIKKIADDYETRVELALLVAGQDIKKAKEGVKSEAEFGSLGIVTSAVKRLTAFVEGRNPPDYDEVELFKDTVFIAIVLNYLQDAYVKKTAEAVSLIKIVMPIYSKYKELATL
jgi:hypothetical protein